MRGNFNICYNIRLLFCVDKFVLQGNLFQAAIVGYYTRKVLFFGVKNKYCVQCARALRKDPTASVPDHVCFRNWSGSSTSMEAAVIVEGFMQSEDMYGAKYTKLIADGDSSVYSNILSARPYDETVVKIECRNHLLRNYSNKLKDIALNTREEPNNAEFDRASHLRSRKILRARIMRLRTAVVKAIAHRKKENGSYHEKAKNLSKDIINSPSHVFGEHLRCADLQYFCKGTGKPEELNHVPEMKRNQIYQKIMVVVNTLADFSSHLILDVDSNIVEHYNSSVAMFTGGKRINYIQKNSYETRCTAAVVSYNTGRPFYKLHKTLTKSSPKGYSKLFEERSKRKAQLNKERRKSCPRARRNLNMGPSAGADKDYGPNAEKPDIDPESYLLKVKEHMNKLLLEDEQLKALEEATVNQSASLEWIEARRERLTASNFGLICNRRETSSCAPVINKLLYKNNVDCAATRYGNKNEPLALAEIEKQTGLEITKCGLFVDRNLQYLAASPDGLIGNDGIIEVKCPSTGSSLTPEEVIEQKKGVVGKMWNKSQDGTLIIKPRHSYHFQVQGQLHVTKRDFCLFCIWTPLGIKIQRIMRDNNFWKKEMEPKLQKFYMECLLPELIDPRQRRSMPIREPTSFIAAQEAKKRQYVTST